MIQPGFAAIGPGSSYGSQFGGNGSPGMGMNDGNGHDTNGLNNGQPNNGMLGGGPHENGGMQQGMMAPQQPEYTLAGILHFLQSEWRRYERDRNEWEIERAEMRARVALLEGERRSVENLKTDLMRRVKMLEFALRQERSKYLAQGPAGAGNATTATGAGPTAGSALNPKHVALQNLEKASTSSGRSSPALQDGPAGHEPRGQSTMSSMTNNQFNTLNTGTLNGLTLGGAGSTLGGGGATSSIHPARQGPGAKDPKARAKSREYLKQCLQEISYLTSATTLNPLPERTQSSSILGPGHSRPRKTMPDNVPSTFGQAGGVQEGQGSATSGAAAARRAKGASIGMGNKGARGLQPFGEALIEREEEEGAEGQGGAEDKHAEGDEGTAPSEGSDASQSEATDVSSYSSVQTGEEADNAPITAIYRPGGEAPPGTAHDDWAKLREAGRVEREKRERERQSDKPDAQDEQSFRQVPTLAGGVTADDDLGALTSVTNAEANRLAAEAVADGQMWKSKKVMQGHLDSVRAMVFDGADIGLYSGSDDGTIKYWRMDAATLKSSKPVAPGAASTADVEPIATLRSHSGAVTCLTLSRAKARLYSGSVDASIVVWKLFDSSINTTSNGKLEPYPPFDKTSEVARLVGHSQAIWDLCILPTKGDEEGLLASASADGTVKIWSIEEESTNGGRTGGSLINSFDYFGTDPTAEKEQERQAMLSAEGGSLPVPTTVSPCMSDLRRCAVGFSNAVVKLFEIQSGKEVMQFASDKHYDGTTASQINKVLTHPTLPTLITGHENNFIQFFDINTGACTLSMEAHLDSVTSLDIDPSGLTLVSGGHDCSVRFWDLAANEENGGAAVCVQEISAHRKKSAEGVLAVKYHPNAPFFCSAGADGVIRLYG